MECDDSSDCNDHGNCIDDSCDCDLGWFGDNCETSGIEEWGEIWTAYRVVFSAIYGILLIGTLISLLRVLT